LFVTGVAVFQTFLVDHVVELLVGGVQQRDVRRGGRIVLQEHFLKFDEVEVVAAIRNLFGAFQRPIRDGSEGQPRRERHRLLGRSQQYVQAQAVEVDLVAAENADRIDQDQRIRV